MYYYIYSYKLNASTFLVKPKIFKGKVTLSYLIIKILTYNPKDNFKYTISILILLKKN